MSITVFATLFIGHVLLVLLHLALVPDHPIRTIEESGIDLAIGFALPILFITRFAIAAAIVWFVWARASKIAKWVAVIYVAGRISQLPTAWEGLQLGNSNSIFWTAATVMGTVGIVFLFTPRSRGWFRDAGRTAEQDAAVFD